MKGEYSSTLPAVTRAFEFVRRTLTLGEWKAGNRLPSAKTLAHQAGVSTRTMIKAIATLKARGLIYGVERGSLRAGNGSVEPEGSSGLNQSWQIKRSRLERDIFSGYFAHHGTLPSSKMLQGRYGVCFATMRKILRSLSNDGIIALKRKKWEVVRSRAHRANDRVVFVPCLYQDRPFSALSNGQYSIIDRFEEECVARGLSVSLAKIDFFDRFHTRRALSATEMTDAAVGYIFDVSFETPELRETYAEFLVAAQKLNRPVAVIDEFGGFALPAEAASNPAVQVFRIAGKSAGSQMALTLLGMGHSSIVYLSPYHDMRWSQQRLAGIEEQFANAGYDKGVAAVTGDQLINLDVTLMQHMAAAGFDEELMRRAFSVDRTRTQVDDVYNRFQLANAEGIARVVDQTVGVGMRKNLCCLADLIRGNPDKDFYDRMCSGALWAASDRIYAAELEPFFERALSHRRATAWICATDAIAVHALSFLRLRKRPVPLEISVSGFDNKPLEGTGVRPTSFDFNAKVFVHRTLDFVLRPPRLRGARPHAPIEIEGVVIERETTARARKSDSW
jgi:DNA-binding LacI/PurR family transcriptional regulator/DNA-binding transcriptional regulator YhcF (GntR family)